MNVTVKVATLFECDLIEDHIASTRIFDPMWRQTVIGCKILDLLRDMYKFNVSYVYDNPLRNVTVIEEPNISRNHNVSADVFARSMSLTADLLDHVYPVHAINTWRFGFLLRRNKNQFFTIFYSKPFSKLVWYCLCAMAILISIIFYLLKRWEFSVLGGWQYSYVYEALMVIAAYCQHIPPINTKLSSRRIAYFIFFVFAYLVYTFYTSNLLSNLVNDKFQDIDLNTLVESDYECVIVDYMKLAIAERYQLYSRNMSIILRKLMALKSVTIESGLDAVKEGQVALLSDYTTIYPFIKTTYDNDDICRLVSIDLFSKLQKYFYTSKNFTYKKQFKIGTLRLKETGILKRLVSTDFEEPKCSESHLIQIRLTQISIPLTLLACTYVTSVLILVAERIHFKRNKVWPYVE